jgi:hypothetical protein
VACGVADLIYILYTLAIHIRLIVVSNTVQTDIYNIIYKTDVRANQT